MRRTVAGRDRRDGLEQLANRHTKRGSQAYEHVGPGIGLTQLDPANILVVQACQLRERFLRQLAILAKPAQLHAQPSDDPCLGFTLLRLNTRFASRHTP